MSDTARFLIDMNLSPRWVGVFTEAGYEAEHWRDVGAGDAADSEILAYAAARKAIVFTNDLDFGAILAATGFNSPSVLQVREEDLTPDVLGGTVLTAVRQFASHLESGALVTVGPKRTNKVRILPIRR